jgi:redox-sensitive bicupin YhaK (pirin superfamily)
MYFTGITSYCIYISRKPTAVIPMIPRLSQERGTTQLAWLQSRHTFSFGEYVDPAHMGYRTLRVINDDIIAPASGFGMHGHRDMEIITVVLSGKLEHQDSLGHRESLRPGEVQVMSAGRGIRHSEYNASPAIPVHLIQIWILPQSTGIEPRYAQKAFPNELRRNRWCQVAGPENTPSEGLKIHQDASVYIAEISAGKSVEHHLSAGRGCWLHVATGSISLDNRKLHAGDAVEITGPHPLSCSGLAPESTVLLFDLA